jgi:hypothetical protein
MLFWVLAPCRIVGRCQRFGETLASTRRQIPEEHHLTAVKTSNLTITFLMYCVFLLIGCLLLTAVVPHCDRFMNKQLPSNEQLWT